MREQLKKDIEDMEKARIIRKSTSPCASPIVIVKKSDLTNRICPDYRNLNKITVFDPEPMMTAESLLSNLHGATYFSKIDLSKGYWQLKMH